MVVGTIIGASIFVQPSLVVEQVPTPAGIISVWVVAGVLTLLGALVCAELASAMPSTGGVYVFLRAAWGPMLGFLWGWAMFWSMHSGIIAAISLVMARYTAHFVPLDSDGQNGVAVAGILVLSAVNYIGVRPGTALQALLTALKVAAVVALVAVLLALGTGAAQALSTGAPETPATRLTLTAFTQAAMAGLFAFGGWHMVTYAAGETRSPERTIPRALWVGVLVVTLCYLLLNVAYLHVLPVERVVRSTAVAAEAADAVLGRGGATVTSAVVVISTLGALTGIVLAGPRVYYAMARDRLLFGFLGAVHPRFRTPHRAIVLQGAWASLLVLTGDYRGLFTRVIYTEWLFFALMTIGLLRLRARSEYSPAYRMRGAPWLPLLFTLGAAGIVINQLAAEPRESAFGLALVLMGLPVYLIWTAWRRKAEPSS
jgi:APA family basic amino acid/polyamine antiporter